MRPMSSSIRYAAAVSVVFLATLAACGDDDDDGGTAADKIGVGAVCSVNEDCLEGQICLPFKGGYCGLTGCTGDVDCPQGSACVKHDDGVNYCFRVCADKAECNLNRPVELESNCSSSIDFVDGKGTLKACVPPSG